jgi:rhodanese-related sulfurtransferase
MHGEGACYFALMQTTAGTRLFRMACIALAGVALGLGWNSLSGRGFILGQSVFVQAGDEVVSATEAKALLDQGALFLDARPNDFWLMHRIKGALSLPEDDFEDRYSELEDRIRHASGIVVYCQGYGCEASHLVARKLRERGFPAVVLDEGLPAWQDEGFALDEESRL